MWPVIICFGLAFLIMKGSSRGKERVADFYRGRVDALKTAWKGSAPAPAPVGAKIGAGLATGIVGAGLFARGFASGVREGWPAGKDRGRTWYQDKIVDRDRKLFDGQPYTDLTGVPRKFRRQPCPRPKCGGDARAVPGSQRFQPDGTAQVSLECRRCGPLPPDFWQWARKPVAPSPPNPGPPPPIYTGPSPSDTTPPPDPQGSAAAGGRPTVRRPAHAAPRARRRPAHHPH